MSTLTSSDLHIKRSSTRVRAPPGGASNLSFGPSGFGAISDHVGYSNAQNDIISCHTSLMEQNNLALRQPIQAHTVRKSSASILDSFDCEPSGSSKSRMNNQNQYESYPDNRMLKSSSQPSKSSQEDYRLASHREYRRREPQEIMSPLSKLMNDHNERYEPTTCHYQTMHQQHSTRSHTDNQDQIFLHHVPDQVKCISHNHMRQEVATPKVACVGTRAASRQPPGGHSNWNPFCSN
ncbi:unnamed protein product [Albugo candida]|uniref:Uncharacterized protein n=1 Tax=Albugo candida TaxID=65357 RepID=A0A024GFT8_9STRA|nr:unnamed protein product [Albugo candida]|eukprot:CCI45741.1 unnamed protein product [Albugo candida]